MSVERELLQEVLDQSYFDKDTVMADIFNRITKLLAQPEHIEDKLVMVEPAAWMYERQNGDFTERTLSVGFEKNFDGTTIPLYTSPPTREPLSGDLINECMENSDSFGFNGDVYIADGDNAFENFARAIEKAHGIGDRDE